MIRDAEHAIGALRDLAGRRRCNGVERAHICAEVIAWIVHREREIGDIESGAAHLFRQAAEAIGEGLRVSGIPAAVDPVDQQVGRVLADAEQ